MKTPLWTGKMKAEKSQTTKEGGRMSRDLTKYSSGEGQTSLRLDIEISFE